MQNAASTETRYDRSGINIPPPADMSAYAVLLNTMYVWFNRKVQNGDKFQSKKNIDHLKRYDSISLYFVAVGCTYHS